MGLKSRQKRDKLLAMYERSRGLAATPGPLGPVPVRSVDHEERIRAENHAAALQGGYGSPQLFAVTAPELPDIDPEFAWLVAAVRHTLPAGWVVLDSRADGWAFAGPGPVYLTVILSGSVELDGDRWVHGSVSGCGRVPTWDEMVATKELFVGPDPLAVMLIPPRSEWVNIHSFVLHWWINTDRRVTPDFTHGRGSI